MIIDFHTHAFPDEMAQQTISSLSQAGKITPRSSGTIEALLSSMYETGIQTSIVCTIATQPSQFRNIFNWLKTIRSEKIIPLPSIHPEDPKWSIHLQQVADAGFHGLKMHPYYQQFALDEKRLYPLYDGLSELGLLLMLHCGQDFAYPPSRRAAPDKILHLLRAFPKLQLVATHMGGWNMWDEVEEVLIGREVYLDTSFSLGTLAHEQAGRMLANHPPEYILFGSDSPWDDQNRALHEVKKMELEGKLERNILGENSRRLLNIP